MDSRIEDRIKTIVVQTLNLSDKDPSSITDDTQMVGAGLEMDSIDALELVVRVEKEFGIKIKSSEEAKTALKSIKSLADFIRAAQQSQGKN